MSTPGGAAPKVVLTVAAAVALPQLFLGLHADDFFLLRPLSVAEVAATFAGDWNAGAQGEGGLYRPLVRLSFAVEGALSGHAPWFSHAVTAALFAAIGWMVFQAGLLLSGGKRWLAAAAAVFVLLSPAKNEAVLWLSGRTDVLATFFVLAALLQALRALSDASSGWARAGGALALLTAGLLSKEVAIAGCAILPLAALLLGRAWDTPRRMLLGGPVLLGVAYLLLRRTLLGGLGGYTNNPDLRSLTQFLEPIASSLSALFAPWQGPAAGDFRNALALPGVAGVVGLLWLGGLRRGALFCAGAMVLALLPMITIDITPADGTRVLLLALCMQALLFCSLFPAEGPPEAAPAGRLGAAVLLAATLLLQPLNLATLSEFQAAGFRNAGVLRAVAADYEGTSNAVFVVPEPPRSAPRRILDPGAAFLMAMENEARRLGSVEHVKDVEGPRFFLQPEASLARLALFPQPWMEGIRLVEFRHNGALPHFETYVRKDLDALTPEVLVGVGRSVTLPRLTRPEAGFVVLEVVVDGLKPWQLDAPGSELLAAFPYRGRHFSTWRLPAGEDAGVPALHAGPGPLFPLRSVRWAVFAPPRGYGSYGSESE